MRITVYSAALVSVLTWMFAPPSVLADPVVPGFGVELYAFCPTLLETLAFDSSGNLYVGNDVADWGRIYKVPPGGETCQEYGDTDLRDPDAVIVDVDGTISGVAGSVLVGGLTDVQYEGYVVAIWPDETTHDIWPQTSAFGNPTDFAFCSGSRLVFTDIAHHKTLIYDPSNDPDGPPPSMEPATLFTYTPNGPYRIAISSDDWIFTSTQDGTIKVHDCDGTLLNESFETSLGQTLVPLAFGPGEFCGIWGTDLYAMNATAGELWRFEVLPDATQGDSELIGWGFDGVPTDMEFGPDGALYVSLHAAQSILRIVPVPAALSFAVVGDRENSPDTRYETPGYGDVDDVYSISMFEVTAGQYTAFLNAVAAADTHGLYHASMDSDVYEYGCNIKQSGTNGIYTYWVDADWADRPVNYVSFWDACRFVNWLHNATPTGAQDASTTEDGAYTLTGYTGPDGSWISRNPDARYWIPNENEWYKAAYYDGDEGVYYDYPTCTNGVPSNDLIEPDPGNNANFLILPDDYTIGLPYARTPVGEFEHSQSCYGTFDQGGNVAEWNETIVAGSSRGARGGGFWLDVSYLHAATRYDYPPSDHHAAVGFRVAMSDCNTNGVPDACEPDFDGDGTIDDCDGDIDGDTVPNELDACHYTPWAAVERGRVIMDPQSCLYGTIRGDHDGDCDCDLTDYAEFQLDFTGPNG